MTEPKQPKTFEGSVTITQFLLSKDKKELPVALDEINNLNNEAFGEKNPGMDIAMFRQFLKQEGVFLVVARDEIRMIVGKATLHILLKDEGIRYGFVNSVAVDPKYQGKGVAPQIDDFLCKIALEEGCSYIELTSNPARLRANAFYLKRGYERRSTNVYRKVLKR